MEEGEERQKKSEDQRLFLPVTSEAIQTKSQKYDLSKDDSKKHDKLGKLTMPKPYTMNCRQLKKAECRGGYLPWGREHQLAVPCHMVTPENIQVTAHEINNLACYI